MKHLILFTIMIILTSCFGTEPQKTGKEGKPMPDFSLLLTDSTTVVHSRDIPSGKPVVLFYFSPHCPYCIAQTKKIVENMDILSNIRFYLISSFPLAEVKKYCTEYQLQKYPNIVTGIDSGKLAADYFEVPGIPYLAIYGKNKVLNKTFLGKIYSSQLKKVAEE